MIGDSKQITAIKKAGIIITFKDENQYRLEYESIATKTIGSLLTEYLKVSPFGVSSRLEPLQDTVPRLLRPGLLLDVQQQEAG